MTRPSLTSKRWMFHSEMTALAITSRTSSDNPIVVARGVKRSCVGVMSAYPMGADPPAGSAVLEDPLDGVLGQFGRILQVELLLDVLAMRLDRLRAELELRRDRPH